MDVVVIGAGLAGLSCARALRERGLSCRILESSKTIGGRLATERLNGFLLDRGLHFLLTAFPEAQRQLDYKALDLNVLSRDMLTFFGGKFHRLSDPSRKTLRELCRTVDPGASENFSENESFLPAKDRECPIDEIFGRQEMSTSKYLEERGIPFGAIDRFWRPLSGAFSLDPKMGNSSRAFEFFWRMLADGDAAIPSQGIWRIPEQIAAGMQDVEIMTDCKASVVRCVQGRHAENLFQVQMNDEEAMIARCVVIAANADERNRLVVRSRNRFPSKSSASNFDMRWNGTVTFYFAGERSPIGEPSLLLNGEGQNGGPVNHACILSDVAPTYAPAGASLICANVITDSLSSARTASTLEAPVREQLQRWFGAAARRWRLLKIFAIPKAIPAQPSVNWHAFDPHFVWPGPQDPFGRGPNSRSGIYVCGDYLETASMQGAMASGVRAAASVAQDLA